MALIKRLKRKVAQYAAAGIAGMVARRYGTKTKSKHPIRRRVSSRTKRRRAWSATVTSKRRRTKRVAVRTEHHFSKMKTRGKKLTAMKLAMACMEPQWYRVQGITQQDTTVGWYLIAHRLLTATNQTVYPMHVWDLTAIPNNVDGGATLLPSVGFSVGSDDFTINTSATIRELNSLTAVGGIAANTQLLPENTTTDTAKRKSYHHWTHIKLNLYGVRKRTTRYVVELVRVDDHTADFINGNSANIEKRKMVDWLVRPFVFNSLMGGDPQGGKHYKVLRRFDCSIDPISLDQYDGTNAVPRIQTLNWFVHHNRVRRYDWAEDDPPALNVNGGFDVVTNNINIRTHPHKRVYLVVRVLCPERRTVTAFDAAADPISEPSYDLIIRQKHSLPV